MTKRSIVHVEIPAKDRDMSAKFYESVFGWNFNHVADQPAPYTLFQTGNTGGGFPDISEMNKVGEVLVYIASDDLQADLTRIEALGGTIVMPADDIPGFGSMAIFTDPAGNRLALWKEAAKA